MYLIDTNVWLERLLGQAQSKDVGRFLNRIPSAQLFMTDFALHSVGVILTRLRQNKAFLSFVEDAFRAGDVHLIGIDSAEMPRLVKTMEALRLDFDDAYQYVAAEKYSLIIVSFDSDFEKTPRGRKSPAELL